MTTTQPEAVGQARGRSALAVLAASVLFELGWSKAHGSNALGRGTGTKRGTGAAGCGPGAAGCGTGTVPER